MARSIKLKKKIFQYRVEVGDFFLLLQALVLGLVFGEIWYFSTLIGSAFKAYIMINNLQPIGYIISLFVLVLLIAYFSIRDGFSSLNKLLNSKRADLLVLILFGLATSLVVGGIGVDYYQRIISKVYIEQLFFLTVAPIAIAISLSIRSLILNNRDNGLPSFFIDDRPKDVIENDSLESQESVSRFANVVLNGNSSDSLVFGINAPWGAGKSTFLNFCCQYWESLEKNKPIVIRFEPLRYKEQEDLVDKLVNSLMDAINKEAFLPSINSLFLKYLKQTRGKKEISFFGVKFELDSASSSADGTLRNLEANLLELDRKIIIVIDDLDRLSWSEVKNILFAVKRSFMLPNVSYVLCYDTENLISADSELLNDAEKVREFLEKFVNVEISLYLDSSVLSKFVSSDIESAINKNLLLDPHLLDQIKLALEALVSIYKSNDYVFYQDFLGDLRKIKRLINTMMLFEIQKTDFKNSDFNKDDLLHLLFIYIHYPKVFRKIYNSETDGKSGFFSLVSNPGQTTSYVNSEKYNDFIKTLNQSQQFLLNKIFNYAIVSASKDVEIARASRACFNNGYGGSGNLERYLRLIVKLTKQEKLDSYQFYISKRDELFRGKSLDELLNEPEFSFANGDHALDQLWSVIANSTNEMDPYIGSSVVLHIIHNIPKYSALDRSIGRDSRTTLGYTLLKILDEAAWGAGITGRRNNTDENISEIAAWVFGEGKYRGRGIISTLSQADRGPLGMFDLLIFRLYCSPDRGSSLFNLHRSILLHGNPNAQVSGLTTDLAKEGMREISQKVFLIFKNQYIRQEVNVFDVINKLTLQDFAGHATDFVKSKLSKNEITTEEINETLEQSKSSIKSFTIYQLTNSLINSGVGCGYYDESGTADKKDIAGKMNQYLFSVCFNPRLNIDNYEIFLDYLLINLTRNFWDDKNKYISDINEFTKVLDVKLLKNYWRRNRNKIFSLDFDKKGKTIFTSNYKATYKEDLIGLFNTLDSLLETKKR